MKRIGGCRLIPLMIIFMVITLSGCSTRYVDQGSGEQVSEYQFSPQVLYQVHDAFHQPAPPRCVMVLPLQGVTDPRRRDLIRRAFYAHLSPRGFRDIEIPRIDHLVERKGLDLSRASDRAVLAEQLQCDAWISGEVNSGSAFYGIYSRMEASAKLSMVRASDGALLWEAEHHASLQDGGLPFSPIGIAAGLFDAARNMEEEQNFRVVDDLARRVMNTIPEVQIVFTEDEQIQSLFPRSETRWEGDFDQWIAAIPEQDQEPRLRMLIEQEPLSGVQQEKVYHRLTGISGKARDYRGWGEHRVERGDYEGALELYRKAASIDPQDSESWFQQGRLLTRLNRIEEADQGVVQAIARNPDRDDYYAALGYLNSIRGRTARARAAYQMALERNPENGFAWYNLAVTDYNAGQFGSSVESFHNAGQFYLRQGRLDRVEQVISDLGDLGREHGIRSALQVIETLKERMEERVRQSSL